MAGGTSAESSLSCIPDAGPTLQRRQRPRCRVQRTSAGGRKVARKKRLFGGPVAAACVERVGAFRAMAGHARHGVKGARQSVPLTQLLLSDLCRHHDCSLHAVGDAPPN